MTDSIYEISYEGRLPRALYTVRCVCTARLEFVGKFAKPVLVCTYVRQMSLLTSSTYRYGSGRNQMSTPYKVQGLFGSLVRMTRENLA
jgi:hypothetical protein